MDLIPLAPLALGALSWRTPAGVQQLTVIAKATFELRHRDAARLVEPYALFDDLHYEENEGRSLRVASDHVPRKASVDVLVTGAVYAPVGERIGERLVRFALVAGDKTVLDKRLRAVGARERDACGAIGAPAPFSYLPLRYELAYGGATSKSNPIGIGADPGDARLPYLLHPDNPQLVAGLGPVPPRWWWRKRTLGGAPEPPSLSQGAPTLPASLDFAYFNAAPPDQQLLHLAGDETVLMTGLHPTLGEVSLPLPGQRAHSSLELMGARREVRMLLDTLWIESDTLRCSLTWRGVVPLAAAEVQALATARLRATLAPLAQPPVWERNVQVDLRTTRSSSSSRAAVEAAGIAGRAAVDPASTRAEPVPSAGGRTRSVELEIQRAEPVAATSADRPRAPQRVTPHVPVLGDTGLQVWTTPWRIKPPEHTLTVIVKGTFDLGGDGELSLSEAQAPPSGDVAFEEAGPGASLRYASDFAIFKPAADILAVGHAYPVDPRSGVAVVDLRVGTFRRSIAVFGDRQWGSGERPAPFEKMPLRWERALGGSLSALNPLGRGYKTGVLLPNLERPEALVRSKGDAPAPACFAPVPPMWTARRTKLGTYDASWLKTRWPYLPADFDWSYFNAAPPEQQVPYLRGDERFSISGMRPGGAAMSGRLPDLRPRAFAQRSAEAGGEFFEVRLHLDTLWLDADHAKIVLVWRGLFAVSDEDAPELAAIFVDEDTKAPRSLEQSQARFAARWAVGPVPAGALGSPDVPPPVARGARPAPPRSPAAAQVLGRLASTGTLAGADLTGAVLAGVDLTGADLSGALLVGADLSGAKLDRAKLSGAALSSVIADGASFEGADLTDADLSGAHLSRARFGGARLSRAVLDGVRAEEAVFSDARCDGATFVAAHLRKTSFDRAELVAAELSKATLDGATFRAARLAAVRLYDAHGERVVFEGASMVGARAEKAVLPGANLASVAAAGSTWEAADLTGAVLSGASLDGAIFTRAKLDGATLNKASAAGASFRRASLRGARCLRTNFMQAIFERADLTGADLRGANLYGAETWRATTDRVDLSLANVAASKLAR